MAIRIIFFMAMVFVLWVYYLKLSLGCTSQNLPAEAMVVERMREFSVLRQRPSPSFKTGGASSTRPTESFGTDWINRSSTRELTICTPELLVNTGPWYASLRFPSTVLLTLFC